MALVGVLCLWIGMRIPVSIWVPSHLPDILDHRVSWAYVRLVLVAGIGFGLSQGSVWIFGAEGRQMMITLVSVVPNVAFVLLLNQGRKIDELLPGVGDLLQASQQVLYLCLCACQGAIEPRLLFA